MNQTGKIGELTTTLSGVLENEVNWLREIGASAMQKGNLATVRDLLVDLESLERLRNNLSFGSSVAMEILHRYQSMIPDYLNRDLPEGTYTNSQDYIQPTLVALNTLGSNASRADIFNWVENHMPLLPNDTELYDKYRTRARTAISFALSNLKERGLVNNPTRGTWAITTSGKKRVRSIAEKNGNQTTQ